MENAVPIAVIVALCTLIVVLVVLLQVLKKKRDANEARQRVDVEAKYTPASTTNSSTVALTTPPPPYYQHQSHRPGPQGLPEFTFPQKPPQQHQGGQTAWMPDGRRDQRYA